LFENQPVLNMLKNGHRAKPQQSESHGIKANPRSVFQQQQNNKVMADGEGRGASKEQAQHVNTMKDWSDKGNGKKK